MLASPCTETVLDDLHAWSQETHTPLIRPPHEIAWCERCGAIIDLVTGDTFYQYENYVDFARRWSDYRSRHGLALDPDALFAALRAAFGSIHDYPDTVWRMVAKTLEVQPRSE